MSNGSRRPDAAESDRSAYNARLIGRFLVLAGLVYALVLIGIMTRNGGAVALAIPMVIYLASNLIHRHPNAHLVVERSLDQDILLQGQAAEVTVRVTNEGENLDEVTVEDFIPEGLQKIEGKTSLLTSLPRGTTAEIKYTVRGPRGSYYFQDVLVSANDHLGILRQRVWLPSRSRLLFLPEITRLKRVAIRPRRTHGHFGPIPSRQYGAGVDFLGLREYQLGDQRRWINWRASAHHDQRLFVNQFEQERIANVGIILDARQQSNLVLDNGESIFEHSIQATGSLSEALLSDGNRVALLIYGFGMERVFPGYGKVQQERILYALGRARTGHNYALESLGNLPTRFFPAGSQIVMVSPLLNEDVPAFTRLRSNGYEILLVSPDPVDFEAQRMDGDNRLALRIARIERVLLLRKLQRLGVRILDWQVSRPFEPLVRATLSRAVPGGRR